MFSLQTQNGKKVKCLLKVVTNNVQYIQTWHDMKYDKLSVLWEEVAVPLRVSLFKELA